ncbi:BA14K family protein [Microbaculum sp. FT89]|uniref:BA14K family protein n=1 Tax=Microbaculum sp. FT89 TaxID=3447298 RepID=UPI003F53CAB0
MKTRLATIACAALVSLGMAGNAAAQSHASCDAYARDYAKRVSSGTEVLGGAAVGAVGGAIIGGIIGGSRGAGTGALIGGGTGAVGGAATHAQRYQNAYDTAYYNCMNQRAAQPAGGMQPWTPAWYQYCSSKYRSFDPNTGYYTTYSGQKRFCQ